MQSKYKCIRTYIRMYIMYMYIVQVTLYMDSLLYHIYLTIYFVYCTCALLQVGMYPLLYAAGHGHLHIVKELVDKMSANISCTSSVGFCCSPIS